MRQGLCGKFDLHGSGTGLLLHDPNGNLQDLQTVLIAASTHLADRAPAGGIQPPARWVP